MRLSRLTVFRDVLKLEHCERSKLFCQGSGSAEMADRYDDFDRAPYELMPPWKEPTRH